MRPQFRFLRLAVYALKRQYPGTIWLVQKDVGQDYTTGVKTITQRRVYVPRAVVLPDKLARAFGPATTQPFKWFGYFDQRARHFIVSFRDIPSTFQVDANLEIIYQHRRYSVDGLETWEEGEVYEFHAKWMEGTKAHEPILGYASNSIGTASSASGS